VAWTCTTILSIYIDKLFQDHERESKRMRKLSLPDHVYDYFLRMTGIHDDCDREMVVVIEMMVMMMMMI